MRVPVCRCMRILACDASASLASLTHPVIPGLVLLSFSLPLTLTLLLLLLMCLPRTCTVLLEKPVIWTHVLSHIYTDSFLPLLHLSLSTLLPGFPVRGTLTVTLVSGEEREREAERTEHHHNSRPSRSE